MCAEECHEWMTDHHLREQIDEHGVADPRDFCCDEVGILVDHLSARRHAEFVPQTAQQGNGEKDGEQKQEPDKRMRADESKVSPAQPSTSRERDTSARSERSLDPFSCCFSCADHLLFESIVPPMSMETCMRNAAMLASVISTA